MIIFLFFPPESSLENFLVVDKSFALLIRSVMIERLDNAVFVSPSWKNTTGMFKVWQVLKTGFAFIIVRIFVTEWC